MCLPGIWDFGKNVIETDVSNMVAAIKVHIGYGKYTYIMPNNDLMTQEDICKCKEFA